MLQLLFLCFFAYCWYKLWPSLKKAFNFINETVEKKTETAYKEPKYNNPLFDYILGSLLGNLSAEERIGIRDNVDVIFNSVFKHMDRTTEIDVGKVGLLNNILDLTDNGLEPKTKALAKRLFNVLELSIKTAPSSYSRKVTLFQLFVFIKHKV